MRISKGTAGKSGTFASCLGATLACSLMLGCGAIGSEGSDTSRGDGRESVDKQRHALGTRPPGGARRLASAQYLRTIGDILGPEARSAAVAPSESPIANFTSNAFEAPVSRSFVLRYESSAIAAAAAAIANPTRLASHAPCVTQGPADADFRLACYQQVAHRVGYLAFRAPPIDQAKEMLVEIGVLGEAESTTDSDKLKSGLKYLIGTIFQAPSFLYSVEIGTPSSVVDEFDLNAFELASRLSLFLLGRAPSEDLLYRAAAGELATPAGIRLIAEELLTTPEARDGVSDHFDELLQLKLLATKGKDSGIYPEFNPALRDAMKEEVLRFVLDIVLDNPRNFFRILDDEQRFINTLLASDVYGIAPPASDWDLVDFATVAPEQMRVGVMTMPALMTVHSHPATNSITRRGLYVYTGLLCQTPNDVPRIDTTIYLSPDGTLREFMEGIGSGCGASCHSIQDPMGFPFENFDAIGQFRTEETTPNGTVKPVVANHVGPFTMFNMNVFPGYDDVRGWADNMTDPAHGFSNCMVQQIYRNAVGVVAGPDQTAAIAAIDANFAGSGYLFQEALIDFVSSPLFTQVGLPR
jgi:hypothetical protein